MGDLLPFLIPVGILAVVAFAFYLGHRAEKKRKEALSQIADSMGFEYLAKGDPQILGRLSGLYLFSQGHSKNVTNLMRGTASELGVSIFDYSYVTGSGKNKAHWRQTVVSFQLPGTALPNFSLRPESIFHKIGAVFGYKDIDFETHPGFSSKYLLRGDDEAAIRSIFREEVLDYFQEKPGLSAEGAGSQLIFYRHAKQVAAEKIQAFMQEAFEVLTLFKVENRH